MSDYSEKPLPAPKPTPADDDFAGEPARRQASPKAGGGAGVAIIIIVLVLGLGCIGLGAVAALGGFFVLFAGRAGPPDVAVAANRPPDMAQAPQEPAPKFVGDARQAAVDAMRAGKFAQPAVGGGPHTYLHIVSSPGDFIGQGKTFTLPGDQIKVEKVFSGVQFRADRWSLNLSGPGDEALQIREYRQAKRFPFNKQEPGLDFSGDGRGNNTLTGEFRVWEIEMEGDNVRRLAVDFVQRSGPPLFGVLRFNSTLQ